MRAPAPARVRPGPGRATRIVLFTLALLAGTGLASKVTATALQWWNERPVTVDAIAVQGARRLRGSEVAAATGLARGARLDALPEDLETRVAAHPWIRSARVALLPTGTLIVDVEEREPRAVLYSGDDGSAHFVDAEGTAFAPVSADEVPDAAGLPALARASGATSASNEAQEAALLRDGLSLLAYVDGLTLAGLARPDEPHRGLRLLLPDPDGERGWVLRGADGLEVVLGSDEVATVIERLDRVERLLGAALGELEQATTIDMRFAGQAVLRTASASR